MRTAAVLVALVATFVATTLATYVDPNHSLQPMPAPGGAVQTVLAEKSAIAETDKVGTCHSPIVNAEIAPASVVEDPNLEWNEPQAKAENGDGGSEQATYLQPSDPIDSDSLTSSVPVTDYTEGGSILNSLSPADPIALEVKEDKVETKKSVKNDKNVAVKKLAASARRNDNNKRSVNQGAGKHRIGPVSAPPPPPPPPLSDIAGVEAAGGTSGGDGATSGALASNPTQAPTPTTPPTEAATEAATTPAPTTAPVPTVEPATPAPTEAATTEAPTEASTTAAPTEASTTTAPTEASTTAAPTEASTTAAPTEASTTAAPTEASTTAAPTEASTIAAPTEASTTAAPTEAATTAAPTWRSVVEEPVDQIEREEQEKEAELNEESREAKQLEVAKQDKETAARRTREEVEQLYDSEVQNLNNEILGEENVVDSQKRQIQNEEEAIAAAKAKVDSLHAREAEAELDAVGVPAFLEITSHIGESIRLLDPKMIHRQLEALKNRPTYL